MGERESASKGTEDMKGGKGRKWDQKMVEKRPFEQVRLVEAYKLVSLFHSKSMKGYRC